jgi:hypothetical protein
MSTEAQPTKIKRKIHRSPNYPSLSLGDAIDRAKQIYDAEKRTPASADTILAHLGYRPGVGPGLRALSALRQYGLLEERNGQDRISDDAFHILTLSETSQDRQNALREAAKRPALIRQVLDNYKGTIPSDLNLRDYLIKTHHFNPDSVATFIKVLRETVELAKLGSEDHTEATDAEGAEQSAEMTEQPQSTKSPTLPATQGERELFRFPLSQGSSVRILVSGPTGPKEIEKLIKVLQLQKELLTESNSEGDDNG